MTAPLAPVTPSLGALVPLTELGSLVAPWLPTGSVLLLARSSCLDPAGAETTADAERKEKMEQNV